MPSRQPYLTSQHGARGVHIQPDVVHVQLLAGRHHDTAVDDILEFAHITRPVVAHQLVDCGIGDPGNPPACVGSKFLDKMPCEIRNVFLALTQRQNFDRDDIQTVIKIFTKRTVFESDAKIAIRRRDHPYVDVLRVLLLPRRSNARVYSCRMQQQLDDLPDVGGHVADLVQHHGARVRQLNELARLSKWYFAPVNAPFSYPNNSLSIRFSGRAVQLILTKGRSLRGE